MTRQTTTAFRTSDKIPWRHISEIRERSLRYIEDRRSGKIKSFRTPWNKFNNFLLQGLDWNSCMTVCARPGCGKTAFMDMITNEAFELNKDQDFAVLKFQFEIPEQTTGAREYAGHTGLTLKQLYSADLGYRLTDADIQRLRNYNEKYKGQKIYQVSQSMTVPTMRDIVMKFYWEMGKIPIVVGIDHSVLITRHATEATQLEMLQNLSGMIIHIKQSIPVIFILLSQMNRDIEKPERKGQGSPGNYPTSNDIFGSDSLMHCSDIVMMLNNPAKLNIPVYGPHKIIASPDLICGHIIKSRVSSEALTFFKSELKWYRIAEMDGLPAQQVGGQPLQTEERVQ